MSNSLVSIITPSFNSMPYIEQTILSVKNQDYNGKIEHIIFDGNSNDGSKEILKKYIHIISTSEPDKGQSDAINKGFNIAKGEIIGWINSDDTYEQGTIKFVVNFFDQNPEVDFIHSDINIINHESKKIGLTRGSSKTSPVSILLNNPIKQPTIFFRREVIDRLKGVKLDLHWTMDREFWLRISLEGFKIVYIKNHIFANFRICEGRKSYEYPDKMASEWIQVTKQYLKNNKYFSLDEEIKLEIINKNKASFFLVKMRQSADNKSTIEMIKYAMKVISLNKQIIFNRGFWKFLVYGILRFRFNRLEKFKKNGI